MKRLGELSDLVDANLIGNPELEISGAKTYQRASATDVTFATGKKHLESFLASQSQAAIIPVSLDIGAVDLRGKSVLQVEDVEPSFCQVVRHFRPGFRTQRMGISDNAHISESARISEDVDIYPGAFIGENVTIGCGSVIHANVTVMHGTSIGAGTTLFPNVVIYENSEIGDRCLIHAGVVIGAYGFGYRSAETHTLSPQLGNVVIGNDVEVGANSTIDRGTYDSTTIGDGTKLDNQVMIGHNCQIGKHNLFCSQVGVAGSCTTGDYVIMAGQVGIGDHLEIGDRTTLAAQSGVMHNLSGDQVYLGSPAMPARDQMKIHATMPKVPEMRKQMKQLVREIERLRFQLEGPQNEAA